MRPLLIALTLLLMTGCATYEPRPSHLKEVTLADGRVVQMYVVGYSIEDFLCEFERGASCYAE